AGRIGSQRYASAVVEVKSGGTVLATQTASLEPGTTRVVLDTAIDPPGAATLARAGTGGGDPLTANNTLRRNVWVGRRVRVLYVEGTPSSARYLSNGLAASGFDVAVRPVSALPVPTAPSEPYEWTILRT